MEKKPMQPGQMQVELGEKEAEGIYSNLVLIGHSPAEFFLDFARILPGIPKAKVYARIVMTPQSARSLLTTLEKTVSRFEEQFGKIKVHGTPEGDKDNIGFSK
jgi:hypothetical protein